jgi:hypothetical protein
MPQDYKLVFLTTIGCIVALIVGHIMGLPVGENIKWSIFFCGMFALVYIFFAYPKGKEDWTYSLGETLSMFGIVVIALAIIVLAFYICVRWENPDWGLIGIYVALIILIILGILGVLIKLHGAPGLASGGEGGAEMWSSGGQKEAKWGVPEVEERYGKRFGWAKPKGSQQTK